MGFLSNVRRQIESNFALEFRGYPIAWENTEFDPPDRQWLQLFLSFADRFYWGVSGLEGIGLTATVFLHTPAGVGREQELELADKVISFFRSFRMQAIGNYGLPKTILIAGPNTGSPLSLGWRSANIVATMVATRYDVTQPIPGDPLCPLQDVLRI